MEFESVRAIRVLMPNIENIASLDLDRALATESCEDQVTRIFLDARDDVYRYLLTLGLYPPQAQDAAQEVFLRLYTELKTGHKIENLRAWIFRVAHNVGVRWRQQENANRPFDPEFQVQQQDPARNPEQALLERERWSHFHSSVEGLSGQQRHCLYLRAEGFRYREIAAIMGISDSTVGEFLRRAITRLKKALNA